MKYSVILLSFIIYTLILFSLSNYYLLTVLFIFQIILALFIKVSLLNIIHNINKLLPYMLFIIFVNIMFSNISNSLIIGIRLLIVCNITYIISYILTPINLSKAISDLLFPLKIFRIDLNQINLIITITLSFIPILIDEGLSIKYSLLSKNFKFNIINLLKQPHVFILTYIKNIFERIEEMEKTLKAKAYN